MRGRLLEGKGLLAVMAGLVILFLAAVLVVVLLLNGKATAGRTPIEDAYISLEPAAG